MQLRVRPSPRSRRAAYGALLALSVLAASCGGEGGGSDTGTATGAPLEGNNLTAAAGESGLKDAGRPARGGKAIYGMEAESAGFCLPEAQLALAGMLVARAVYDTLTVPNAEGGYSPYLAQSIVANPAFTDWTIVMRKGVDFHDGSPLTAAVVKNNLDAYRGKYPGRASASFSSVLANIADVTVVDRLTLKVRTTTPWPALPSILFSGSRLGIMAQAQLDDADTCARNLIGTGPFEFMSWTPDQKLEAKRNPDYWQIAPDGKPYPYLDAIEFRPILDPQARAQALEANDINILHTADAKLISTKWKKARDDGRANLFVSHVNAEIDFVQLNETLPPFDDLRMRQALAMSLDPKSIGLATGNGLPTILAGPMAPGSIGYVRHPGLPGYDPTGAKKLVAEYKADGGNPTFSVTAGTTPTTKQTAELVQQAATEVGMEVKIAPRDQAALINDALAKKFQAMLFRNYPGGDPDANYLWWKSGTTAADGTFVPNPLNFAGFRDDDVDKLLDKGRVENNPAKRAGIYQDLDRRMATQVHGAFLWVAPWAIVESPKMHGVLGPPLPANDASKAGDESTSDPRRQPSVGLVSGHSLIGLWIEK